MPRNKNVKSIVHKKKLTPSVASVIPIESPQEVTKIDNGSSDKEIKWNENVSDKETKLNEDLSDKEMDDELSDSNEPESKVENVQQTLTNTVVDICEATYSDDSSQSSDSDEEDYDAILEALANKSKELEMEIANVSLHKKTCEEKLNEKNRLKAEKEKQVEEAKKKCKQLQDKYDILCNETDELYKKFTSEEACNIEEQVKIAEKSAKKDIKQFNDDFPLLSHTQETKSIPKITVWQSKSILELNSTSSVLPHTQQTASKPTGPVAQSKPIHKPNLSMSYSENGIQQPKMRKTKMCIFFTTKGCQNGTACSFAHDKSELVPVSNYKTQLCCNYGPGKKCIYGNHCQFAHGANELR